MDVLVENRYARLALDRPARALFFTRSAEPYESLADYADLARSFDEATVTLHRASHVLLIDLRAGPLRNDPEFETVSARFRTTLHKFARIAVLVRSQVGRLQILRHAHEQGTVSHVFLDEGEALQHLGIARPTRAP